jgi:hypothetical protein
VIPLIGELSEGLGKTSQQEMKGSIGESTGSKTNSQRIATCSGVAANAPINALQDLVRRPELKGCDVAVRGIGYLYELDACLRRKMNIGTRPWTRQ